MNRKKRALNGNEKQPAKKRAETLPLYSPLYSFSSLLLPLVTAAAEARSLAASRAGRRRKRP